MGRVNSMVEQNGVVYYLEEASTKIIEKYDEHLKACVKDSEYYFIRGYFGNVKELDLSWIGLHDVVDLHGNPGLSKIFINCSNIKNALFKIQDKIVCDISVDCNVVVAGAALKRFLGNNTKTIEKINFHNVFNPIVKSYLEDMCSKYDIETEFMDYGIQLKVEEVSNELVA